MSKTLLDLKNFKHVSSDESSTTLEHHKDGHKIILAHKALSPKTQEQLKQLAQAFNRDKPKLAEGGEISDDQASKNYENVMADKNAENALKKATEFDPFDIPVSDPNKQFQDKVAAIKKLPAMPGDEITEDDARKMALDEMQNDKSAIASREKQAALTEKSEQERQALASTDKKIAADRENEQLASVGVAPIAPAAADPEVATGRDAAAKYFTNDQSAGLPNGDQGDPSQLVGQEVSGTGTANASANPDQFNNPEGMLKSGYENQLEGINATAQAQGDLGAKQAEILNQQAKAQQDAQIAFKQNYSALEKERQAHIQDIKDGFINPDRYWTGYTLPNGEKVSGHSKIMSGIGMILAGFNPTGNPNAAINFLKDQMDRNIQAQARNLQAGDSLLAHNLQQFGNMKDAAEFTRMQLNDVTQNYLQSAAATAQNPMAKAAALLAVGKLKEEDAPKFRQFAMQRAMMELANDPNKDQGSVDHLLSYMRVMNPEMAKEMESRYVPGSGLASVPIPQEARSEIIGKQNFEKMSQHYIDWVKQNANSLNPAKIKAGATMAAELQGAYRQSTKGGTFKEGEQEFIEKLIPSNPAQFVSSIRTLPKLEALLQSNRSQLNNLKSGYGLPVKAEPEYKMYKGVKYMRGPNGLAIPAK